MERTSAVHAAAWAPRGAACTRMSYLSTVYPLLYAYSSTARRGPWYRRVGVPGTSSMEYQHAGTQPTRYPVGTGCISCVWKTGLLFSTV